MVNLVQTVSVEVVLWLTLQLRPISRTGSPRSRRSIAAPSR
jgi:hypothetical protein